MHYPTTTSGKNELSKKVAAVHTEAILNKLRSTPCPKEQKLELIANIKQALSGSQIT